MGVNGFSSYEWYGNGENVLGISNESQVDAPFLKMPGLSGIIGTFVTDANNDPMAGAINLGLGFGRKEAQGIQTETGKYNSDYFDAGLSCES